MKLYHVQHTRSARPRWVLEEIGAPYELVRVDVAAGEQRSAEYLARVNPMGHVPALVDGEQTLFESAAICAYLADKFPEKHLAPPAHSALRGPYYQWLFFSMTELDQHLFDFWLHTRLLPDEKRVARIAEIGAQGFHRAAEVLARSLGDRPFLVGDGFTVVDVMVTTLVNWARAAKLAAEHPSLLAYARRHSERPAYRRAVAD